MIRLVSEHATCPEPGKMRYIVFTVIASLNTEILMANFARYVNMSTTGIESVKHVDKKTGVSIYRTVAETPLPLTLKTFNNQVTVQILTADNKQINVKIFRNGKLQMTGCRGLEDGVEISNKLKSILKDDAMFTTTASDELKVTNVYIGMINSIFHTNFEINRHALVDLIRSTYSSDILTCNFEVNNYQGISLKKKSKGGNTNTFLIFRSGKTLITGGKCIADMEEMFTYINHLFHVNYDSIVLKKPVIVSC